MVAIQDEKSQHKNKAKALSVLRARLLQIEEARQAEERGEQRRSQVGSGERAEKIRTYNFPDDRITDHRVGVTVHNLPGLLEGDLDRLVEPLAAADQAARLARIGADDSA
jgi:peptide chain release factor 1